MTPDPCRFHLASPYTFAGHQHKVQLHVHTTRSDGRHDPGEVMRIYADNGYAAVAITDHDYRDRTSPSLDDPGGHALVHIPGVEYSANAANESWRHLLCVLIDHIHHTDGWNARQAQIRHAAAGKGLSFLCHPYGDPVHCRGWSAEDMLGLEGYSGMEIYNGASCGQADILAGFSQAVDRALVAGRRLWLIATDDFHANPDLGYVVINSPMPRPALKLDDVAKALRAGNFFSVGRMDSPVAVAPHFTDIRVDGHTLTVELDRVADIAFITARSHTAVAATGAPDAADGAPDCACREHGVSRARYTACPRDRFVRVVATVRRDGHEARGWSNPAWVAGLEEGR